MCLREYYNNYIVHEILHTVFNKHVLDETMCYLFLVYYIM